MTHALSTVDTYTDHLGNSYTVTCQCDWQRVLFTDLSDVINQWGQHVATEALKRHHELESDRVARPAVGIRDHRIRVGILHRLMRRGDTHQPPPRPPAPRHLTPRAIGKE